jgi:galactitol PTS system EIIC component
VKLFSGFGWLAVPAIAAVIGICIWLLKARAATMEALASASPDKTAPSKGSRVSA